MSPSSPESDQLADHVDGRAVEERVARHQHEAALVRRARRARPPPRSRPASGFSTKTCLPAWSAAHRERVVRRDRRRDRDRVDVGSSRTSRSRSSWRPPDSGARSARAPPRRRSQTAGDVRARRARQVADEVRAPVAEPDDADAHALIGHRRRRSAGAGSRAACGRAGAGRGRATSRARTRRPCRAPRRRSSCARAVTCQRPVMPAGTRKRSKCCGSEISVSYGMHGRGPTSDMSPLRTLISCGSSSRLVSRSHFPNFVTASIAVQLVDAVLTDLGARRHRRLDVLPVHPSGRHRRASSGT